jgi:2-iminobutanoate/2-iminopropanoate deaminase
LSRRIISTELAGRGSIPSSQGAVAGNLVFTSGHGALEPGTAQIEAQTFEAQVRRTVANISAVLEAAGTSLEHCVKIECFLRHERDVPEYNRIYREIVPQPYPPRVTFIANLVRADADIEMSAIAVIPDAAASAGNA